NVVCSQSGTPRCPGPGRDAGRIPMLDVKGRYAIVGIGETAVGKLPETTTFALTLQAVHRALADAGLKPSDVDAVFCDQPNNSPQRSYALTVAHAAGIP